MANKNGSPYKGYQDFGYFTLDEFEHRFAKWAQNHNNWAKAKVWAKRTAKRRKKRDDEAYIKEELNNAGESICDSAACRIQNQR